MATLAELRDRDNPMPIDRAKAVAEVATVLINSAKVEVAYIQATKRKSGEFFRPGKAVE